MRKHHISTWVSSPCFPDRESFYPQTGCSFCSSKSPYMCGRAQCASIRKMCHHIALHIGKTKIGIAVHNRMRVKSRSARSVRMMPTPGSIDRNLLVRMRQHFVIGFSCSLSCFRWPARQFLSGWDEALQKSDLFR